MGAKILPANQKGQRIFTFSALCLFRYSFSVVSDDARSARSYERGKPHVMI
jgi:hypothetical protein